ncbi:MAG TPA: universal stress protein [Burkholderiales bacterium]|nr:universal stress protein [Burkholderiales bacterium]
MTYRTIVVHLGADERRRERLEIACGLAAAYDSHLVGLFALGELLVPFALGGNAGAVIELESRWRDEVAGEARRDFDAAAARAGIQKTEWRRSERSLLSATRLSARYADLVVVGQPDPERAAEERIPGTFVEELVLSAGRPVLVVPYAGRFPRLGTRVLVAWNASREAARALTDALPLLRRAGSVEVVAFEPQRAGADHGAEPGADIALYLARHGVKVSAARQQAGIDVGSQILSRAADSDADLIVMGAYGHSRAREIVLGGATRSLLQAMTVPVLMAH